MELEAPPEEQRPRRGRTLITVVLTLCIAAILVVGGWLITGYVRDPFSALRNQKVSFTIYIPAAISKWSIPKDTVSTNNADEVLLYQANGNADIKIALTQSAIPRDFKIDDLKADVETNTPHGRLFITDAADRTTAALFTKDGTWILANSPTSIGSDAMKEFMLDLSPLPKRSLF